MKTTLLKLIVSAPEEVVGAPDTGQFMRDGAGMIQNNINLWAVLSIVAVLVGAVALTALMMRKKKYGAGFTIASGKRAILSRSLLFISIVSAISGAGSMIASGNRNVGATGGEEETQSDVEFTTRGIVTIEAQLDEEENVAVCGTDVVTISQTLPAGYDLYMSAGDLALSDDESVVIASIEETGALAADSWGYRLNATSGDYTTIPAESTLLRNITLTTEENDATNVQFCVSLSPETEVGTYEAEISYSVDPHTVQYSLNYDANGGSFNEAPEAQSSEETIATSYDFMITSVEPTVPVGTALNFYGWSLTGDSLSDVYQSAETITVTEAETTLKAVYGYDSHTITYHQNIDEEVSGLITAQRCIVTEEGSDSCSVKITSRVPTTTGYTLLGWSKTEYAPAEGSVIDDARAKIDYLPGDEITLDDDLDLYGIWWQVSTNDFQIELRWGEVPDDLDSHLVAVRNSDGVKEFEVYFAQKTKEIENGTITLSANLDIDDMSSYGPETVTLNMLPLTAYSDYTFYYYVYNFSGEQSGLMSESGANITLIKAGGATTEYNISAASGSSAAYWNVFAIKNGEIVVKNTMTATADLSY